MVNVIILFMQSQTSDNSGFNKLKTIVFLGLSCNHTTIIGCVLIWMFLSRNELSSFWNNIKIVLCVLPFFMGDAVNKYVLGRIKLEQENGWDDIRMVASRKAHIAKFYNLYRTVSIVSSYGLAFIMVLLMTSQAPKWLLFTIASVVIIHFLMSLTTIIKGIAPIIPRYKKQGLIYRGLFIISALAIWYFILNSYPTENISHLFVFTSGMLYFVICGMMHPLPANGSLFQSIIKESIISQAQAEARERTNAKEQILYNINSQNVEDASIIETKTNMNVSINDSEMSQTIKTVESSSSSESNDEISDAIVVTTANTGEVADEQQQ